MMRSVWPQSARPKAVRGSRAPVEYGGKPADGRGSTWGTTVPTGTPAISPAIAGASVRMSAITHSGRSSSMSGSAACAALTTAS
jgi:hypothetical protein